MEKTVAITVKGKVQGVDYRHSTRELALAAGVKGYVKNMPDGSVHIIATGNESQLQQLEQWCKTGPQGARVESVTCEEIPFSNFKEFTIQR